MKVIVFDLGGTLMQYVGMPYSWIEFYKQGFEAINHKYDCMATKETIEKSVELLTTYNPRISHREIEYSANFIFQQVLEHWRTNIPIELCINTFWNGLNLKAEIYKDSIDVLTELKSKGYIIATLTDLPNAMPDELFKKDIWEILTYIDYYVSSSVAGYRKPNYRGLQLVADKYGISISDIVFVGDEEKDRQTALNAGCEFIKIDRSGNSMDSISSLYELPFVE